MSRFWGALEYCYAELLGLLAFGVAMPAHSTGALHVDGPKLGLLLPSAIEIAGVILGFAMAAEAIVLGLSGPMMKRYNDSGGFKLLLWFMTSLTVSAFLMLVTALVVLMIYPVDKAGAQVSSMWVGILAGFGLWMVAAVLRVIRSMQGLVRVRFNQKPTSTSG